MSLLTGGPDVVENDPPTTGRSLPRRVGVALLAGAVGLGAYLVSRPDEPGPSDATAEPNAVATPPPSLPAASEVPTPSPPETLDLAEADPAVAAIELVRTTGPEVARGALGDPALTPVTAVDATIDERPLQVWFVAEGVVVFTPPTDTTAAAADPSHGTFALHGNDADAREILGIARYVIPAAAADRFWLASAQAPPPGDPCRWRLVDLAGETLASADLPCGFAPVRETDAGFAATDADDDGDPICALRSADGASSASVPGFVAGANDRVTVCADFGGALTLFTGASTSLVPPPPGRTTVDLVSAQVSPAGTYLAASFYVEPGRPETWVYDLARAEWRFVAGVEATYGESMTWADDVLVLVADDVSAYDPTVNRLYTTHLPISGRPGGLDAR